MYLSLDLLHRECFWKDKKGMTGKETKARQKLIDRFFWTSSSSLGLYPSRSRAGLTESPGTSTLPFLNPV